MEVLSRKTYVETGKSLPRIYMTAKQLSEYDRELLVAGIPLSDENALRQAIEDYTS